MIGEHEIQNVKKGVRRQLLVIFVLVSVCSYSIGYFFIGEGGPVSAFSYLLTAWMATVPGLVGLYWYRRRQMRGWTAEPGEEVRGGA